MNYVTHPLSSAYISIFPQEISKFALSRNTDIDCMLIHNFQFFLTYFESLRISLTNIIAILIMSAKIATIGFLKIKVFWNKKYNVIISANGIINQFLSRGSNCIVDVVRWPKFVSSSIYIKEVVIPQCYNDLARKISSSEGYSWLKFSNLGMALIITLKFYINVEKGSKLKTRKFKGLILRFAEVTEEKLVGGPFWGGGGGGGGGGGAALFAPSPFPPPPPNPE